MTRVKMGKKSFKNNEKSQESELCLWPRYGRVNMIVKL